MSVDLDAYLAEREAAQYRAIAESMDERLGNRLTPGQRRIRPPLNPKRPENTDNGYDPHRW